MEDEKQREERHAKMYKSLFAQFKLQGTKVPNKNGVVEATIDGDVYQLKLWGVRHSMLVWTDLVRNFTDPLLIGMMGIIRYRTQRKLSDGTMVTHLEDLKRGEDMIASAVDLALEKLPEKNGFFSLVLEYFPKVLTRKVELKDKTIWVDVFDPSEKEDVREVDGIPLGFDNFYIGKHSTIYKLMFWMLCENLGGFFFEKFQSLFQTALPDGTEASSP